MSALDLILGVIGGLSVTAYVWLWLRSAADLVWLVPIRPWLAVSTLLTIFAVVCLLGGGAAGLGPWTTGAVAIVVVPVVGLAVINVVAWNVARRKYERSEEGSAVITWQANAARPLAGVPDLLNVGQARWLRRQRWWWSLRRAVWAARGYALQHRQAELFSAYERPPIEETGGFQ